MGPRIHIRRRLTAPAAPSARRAGTPWRREGRACCQQPAAMPKGGKGKKGKGGSDDAGEIPEGWEVGDMGDGNKYYFHIDDPATIHWDGPPWEAEAAEKGKGKGKKEGKKETKKEAKKAEKQEKKEAKKAEKKGGKGGKEKLVIPEGWEEGDVGDGNKYYFHVDDPATIHWDGPPWLKADFKEKGKEKSKDKKGDKKSDKKDKVR